METLTVAVSVYNGEKYIKRCIKSILNQSYHAQEIIIYDDASTDGTVEVVRKLANKYKSQLICSSINRGPGGGKMEALKHATMKYVLFVDADDYLSGDYVKR